MSDSAAALDVAAPLVSVLAAKPLPSDAVLFGEVSLSGEVRPVAHAGLRLKEAAKLGFQRAMVPPSVQESGGMQLKQFRTLSYLVDHILGRD